MVPICGEAFEAQSEAALKRPGLYRERWERTVPEAIFFLFSSLPSRKKGLRESFQVTTWCKGKRKWG